MNNKTLLICGVCFVALIAVLGFAGDGKSRIQQAAEACQKNGKQLKSFKDTSTGVEFTCE